MTPDDFPLYRYAAELVRVKDGDTAVIRFRLGFRVTLEIPVRLMGYNAPELHGPNPNLARDARDALQTLLSAPFYVETAKDAQTFERWLGRVYVAQGGQLVDVATIMTARGFNVPQGQ